MMVEVIATIARWLQLAANFVVLGSCLFIAIAHSNKFVHLVYSGSWIQRLERLFLWLAFSIPVCLLVGLITIVAQMTGSMSNLWQQSVWFNILRDTHVGQVWLWRVAASLLLIFFVLYLINAAEKTRWRYVLCAFFATVPLLVGSLTSHIAADELSLSSYVPYALHLIFAGAWFGALPALLLLIYDDKHTLNLPESKSFVIETIKRFSAVALPIMCLIIVTGIWIANHLLEGFYAALVATSYGLLLSGKVALLGVILIIAASIRSYWLPLLANNGAIPEMRRGLQGMRNWVGVEFLFAFILLLIATLIANAEPVKNASIDDWFFPFRFSITATWNKPNVALQVWSGFVVLILAASVAVIGFARQWSLKRLIGIPVLFVIASFVIILPPLAIEAYSETYRKPTVSFDAASIANGSALYAQHCLECHGVQGMGNGIKSRTLSTKLPDLLMELHTVDHTPGDFYNWITYGMKGTDMPGFVEKLTDDDRWDLVNYLHALSRGYQARILSPNVVPDKAFARPPVFSFTGQDGYQGNLQEYRSKGNVLLILFTWPQSNERLAQLSQAYGQLKNKNTEVIAVPITELGTGELTEIRESLPFHLILHGGDEIVSSYMLWRRTLGYPDIIGKGVNLEHIEFMLDKNGYMRARWIPAWDQFGWSDIGVLEKQIDALNREQIISVFSDEYVR
ncbi:MAG: CopD family protein [Nitrosomonas sp.]|nr:MAG: CopD family protein [Nitrosomonas sp.]